MKRILLLVLLAAGMAVMAVPAQAAPAIHAFPHGRIVIGWPGWGWGWGYPGYYGPYYARSYGPPVWARVKTDVEPDEARLYLDGQLIGTADDFDGWPDYLYLQRGHYKLEFQLDGYESKTYELDARPGQTMRLDYHLNRVPGAKHRGSYEEPKIEGGIQRFWAKRQNVATAVDPNAPRVARVPYDRPDQADAPDRGAPGNDEDWRGNGRPATAAPADADADADADAVAPSPRTRLRLHVEPADAAVYVDDRFVGTGEEVNSLDRGLALAPGKHNVTVSRPGYQDKTSSVVVTAGKTQTVEISLER